MDGGAAPGDDLLGQRAVIGMHIVVLHGVRAIPEEGLVYSVASSMASLVES